MYYSCLSPESHQHASLLDVRFKWQITQKGWCHYGRSNTIYLHTCRLIYINKNICKVTSINCCITVFPSWIIIFLMKHDKCTHVDHHNIYCWNMIMYSCRLWRLLLKHDKCTADLGATFVLLHQTHLSISIIILFVAPYYSQLNSETFIHIEHYNIYCWTMKHLSI